MFKAFLIKMLADAIFDEVITATKRASRRSSNKIDDKLVKVLQDSKPDLIKGLQKKL